jgi:hypothetical protein
MQCRHDHAYLKNIVKQSHPCLLATCFSVCVKKLPLFLFFGFGGKAKVEVQGDLGGRRGALLDDLPVKRSA